MTVLALALGGVLYLSGTGRIPLSGAAARSGSAGDTAVDPAGAGYVTVTCITPVGEPLIGSVEPGAAYALPDGPEIAGYTFLGWADADGVIETHAEINPYVDTQFSARYAIAFRDESAAARHEPYMSLDDAPCPRARSAPRWRRRESCCGRD